MALAALAAFATVLSASAADEKAAPPAPPQPRVVEALRPEALPPRSADPSWLQYQEGLRLSERRRFDEALLSFKDAIETRASLFDRVSRDVEAALATKEAARAKGSLSALVELLAARDLIPQDLEATEAKAGSSIVAELGLLRERSPSNPLRGLIDAVLLVVDERGLSRIGDSTDALRKAAADLRYYPEAEFGIGRIVPLAEGEARLAELQMLRAYDMSGSLELGDDRYAMLESLADVYKAQGDLQDYEQRLREIADASDLFAAKDAFYRNAMERTLAQQGVDKFMTLYRVEEGFATRAYSSLGSLYLEAGRPLAVIYLRRRERGPDEGDRRDQGGSTQLRVYRPRRPRRADSRGQENVGLRFQLGTVAGHGAARRSARPRGFARHRARAVVRGRLDARPRRTVARPGRSLAEARRGRFR